MINSLEIFNGGLIDFNPCKWYTAAGNWYLYTRRRRAEGEGGGGYKWQTKTISRYLETDKLLKRLMNVNNARRFTFAFSTPYPCCGYSQESATPSVLHPPNRFKHCFSFPPRVFISHFIVPSGRGRLSSALQFSQKRGEFINVFK